MFRHGHGGKSRKGLHVKPGLLPGPGRTIRGLGWGYTSLEDLKNLLALGERWIQPGHQSDTPPIGRCVAEAEAVLNWATPAFFLRPIHQSPELCKDLCHRIGEGVPSLFSAGAFPPRPPTIDLFHHLHGAGTLMNHADFVRNIAGWLVRGEENAWYLFGGDNLARDVFSRMVMGSRVVLSIAPAATIFAFMPMLLMQGQTGDYAYSLPMVVVLLLLASWFLSMGVTLPPRMPPVLG